jgi:hypothetical protein
MCARSACRVTLKLDARVVLGVNGLNARRVIHASKPEFPSAELAIGFRKSSPLRRQCLHRGLIRRPCKRPPRVKGLGEGCHSAQDESGQRSSQRRPGRAKTVSWHHDVAFFPPNAQAPLLKFRLVRTRPKLPAGQRAVHRPLATAKISQARR